MDGRLIAFNLPPGLTASQRVQFNHRLWGRRTTTAGGRYRHEKTGLMDRIPHRRLVRGVLLLREQDLEPLIAFLEEWDARTHVRRVVLEPEDQRAMQTRPE